MLLIPRAKGFASSAVRRDSYVLNVCVMCPNVSTLLLISRSKNPLRSSPGPAWLMYSSTVSTRGAGPPAGMSRAPGTNRDRIRSHLRGWPAGPEMTS
jgi:hypothetical protein